MANYFDNYQNIIDELQLFKELYKKSLVHPLQYSL